MLIKTLHLTFLLIQYPTITFAYCHDLLVTNSNFHMYTWDTYLNHSSVPTNRRLKYSFLLTVPAGMLRPHLYQFPDQTGLFPFQHWYPFALFSHFLQNMNISVSYFDYWFYIPQLACGFVVWALRLVAVFGDEAFDMILPGSCVGAVLPFPNCLWGLQGVCWPPVPVLFVAPVVLAVPLTSAPMGEIKIMSGLKCLFILIAINVCFCVFCFLCKSMELSGHVQGHFCVLNLGRNLQN